MIPPEFVSPKFPVTPAFIATLPDVKAAYGVRLLFPPFVIGVVTFNKA